MVLAGSFASACAVSFDPASERCNKDHSAVSTWFPGQSCTFAYVDVGFARIDIEAMAESKGNDGHGRQQRLQTWRLKGGED